MVTANDAGGQSTTKPDRLTALECLARRDPTTVAKMLVDLCWIEGAVELGSDDALAKLERLTKLDDSFGKIALVLRYPKNSRHHVGRGAITDTLIEKWTGTKEHREFNP